MGPRLRLFCMVVLQVGSISNAAVARLLAVIRVKAGRSVMISGVVEYSFLSKRRQSYPC